ncbi:PREDICTED: two-component response regulator ARR21 [Prunus dulcis]|uniref:PREDICTED: two-component response regulator ARR21 n=1 Tax=Prunus dulcis TaxID=3755 RepID=A0A5E4F3F1_PRUDU|nr:PREDICTED: two-component response regulator ARR21 [Prunus dulcis]
MSSSFHNLGSHFNDENQFEVYWQWFCSAGFETGASSASQFPPNFPDNKGDLDQQQNVPVLPPPEGNFNDQCGMPNINVGGGNVENSNRGFMNNTKTVVAPPSLINNNNISHEQESSSCSAGFETGASSAYQFPPNFPDNKGDLDQQQNVPVLPPQEGNFNDQCGLPNINVGGGNVENSNRGFMNNTNTVVAPPTLINNNNISQEQESYYRCSPRRQGWPFKV